MCGYEEPTVLHFLISGAESWSQSTAESQWEVQGGSSGQSEELVIKPSSPVNQWKPSAVCQ